MDLTRLGVFQMRITDEDGDKGIEGVYRRMTTELNARKEVQRSDRLRISEKIRSSDFRTL